MKNQRRSAFNARQYMIDCDFEVYYYSDLHFKSVGSHSHDYYEFYFFEEGSVRMYIKDRSFVPEQGDVIVVPPGVDHRVEILKKETPYRRFVFWVGKTYLETLTGRAPIYGYLSGKAARGERYLYRFDELSFNALRAQLFSLLDEYHSARFGREEELRLQVCGLLLQLSRMVFEEENNQKKEAQSLYEALSGYIDEHLNEELTLERIAAEFYISKYYLAHLFKESTGLSLHRYMTKKRLAAACAYIRSGTPISQASASCGFADYTAFFRAFVKEYGMSPSDYKEFCASAPENASPGYLRKN